MSITATNTVTTAATPSRFDRVSNYSALGGIVGAGAGALVSLLPLPFLAFLTAPIGAAIGGAVGLVAGTAIGLFKTRHSESISQATAGAGSLGTPPPVPGTSGGLPPALPA